MTVRLSAFALLAALVGGASEPASDVSTGIQRIASQAQGQTRRMAIASGISISEN